MQDTQYWFLNNELMLNYKTQQNNFSLRHVRVASTYLPVNMFGVCLIPSSYGTTAKLITNYLECIVC